MSSISSADVTALLDAHALGQLHISWNDIKLAEQPLGRGGFGAVYRGSWRGLKVAVKMLDGVTAAACADLQREALMMSSVRHPGIAIVYGLAAEQTLNSEVEGGSSSSRGMALVMRYYKRGAVAQYLGGMVWAEMSELRRLRLAMQVCVSVCEGRV